MTIEEDRKAEANHHTRWAEDIRKRNERYSEESNWFPFVQNVEDILSRIDKMSERFDDLENKIGETQLLRIGTFQLEVAPNEDIDVRAFFNETLDKLISAYGERLLEIDVKGLPVQPPSMHG